MCVICILVELNEPNNKMAYITKWIEGEKNLHEFCIKRFGEKPRFVETIGRVGDAKVELIYKWKEGYGYVAMYLLYMQHPTGTIHYFDDIRRMTYEEIRADRTSILN